MAKQTARTAESAPDELPAQVQDESSEAGEARPQELAAEDFGITAEFTTDTVPVMTPPDEIEGVGYQAGYSAWQNKRKISALWCINQTRNSWAHIAGIGWKRLSNKCDSGTAALSVLASHAKQIQSQVNYREETDKMIHEMYVW